MAKEKEPAEEKSPANEKLKALQAAMEKNRKKLRQRFYHENG